LNRFLLCSTCTPPTYIQRQSGAKIKGDKISWCRPPRSGQHQKPKIRQCPHFFGLGSSRNWERRNCTSRKRYVSWHLHFPPYRMPISSRPLSQLSVCICSFGWTPLRMRVLRNAGNRRQTVDSSRSKAYGRL